MIWQELEKLDYYLAQRGSWSPNVSTMTKANVKCDTLTHSLIAKMHSSKHLKKENVCWNCVVFVCLEKERTIT